MCPADGGSVEIKLLLCEDASQEEVAGFFFAVLACGYRLVFRRGGSVLFLKQRLALRT